MLFDFNTKKLKSQEEMKKENYDDNENLMSAEEFENYLEENGG